jgi:LacI family transcriptional regulator
MRHISDCDQISSVLDWRRSPEKTIKTISMKKVRLADIAREAQVGSATVERVLNARGNVSPATTDRVIQAARRLGYKQPLPERYHGILRIEVIMVRRETPFFARLAAAFQRISESLDPCIQLHRTFADENDPISVARRIASPGFRRMGLIIVAPDHPEVRAKLRQAKDAGEVVVQIVSRIGDDDDLFIGIDNYAAGRTAAQLMSRMSVSRPGRFVALCHSGAYHVHRERIRGFSEFLEERGLVHHLFSRVLFGLDQDLRSAEIMNDALNEETEIIGVYNAGGANEGVAAALERNRNRGSIFWIGHELTDASRRWLKSGLMDVVLDQAPEAQARRSIDMLLNRLGFITAEVSAEPIRFYMLTSESV